MNNQLNRLLESAIPFPITTSWRQQAKAYGSKYFVQDVQKKVYLNTLAVLVADAYLRLLGFESDLTTPTRWNAVYRLWSERNELELVGLGNLECCVIGTREQSVVLPPEIDSNLIGYLFVEISSNEKEATLLGFLPASDLKARNEEIAIADLQSMDDLIDYLGEREASKLAEEFAAKKITYLRNWLNQMYTADWEPSMRDLKTATCKKKFQLANQILEMQLSVAQSNDELILVRVIVRGESTLLPQGLQVSVPDESEIYTVSVTESADLISIPLELSQGEEFWVELRIEQTFVREYFSV